MEHVCLESQEFQQFRLHQQLDPCCHSARACLFASLRPYRGVTGLGWPALRSRLACLTFRTADDMAGLPSEACRESG